MKVDITFYGIAENDIEGSIDHLVDEAHNIGLTCHVGILEPDPDEEGEE